MSWFNRFTTGRIPADAKRATMAELDEPAEEPNFNLFESFGLFQRQIINQSFNGLAYNTREHFAHC